MATADSSRPAVAVPSIPLRSRRGVWSRFRRHKLALMALGVLAVLCLAAILAPVISVHSPTRIDIDNITAAPSRSHILGTNAGGQDVFARLVYAARVSLSVGLVAALIASVIGTVVGLVSGYVGGKVDDLLQRFTELVMTIPSLFAVILLIALVGASVFNIMVVIGVLGWTGKARLVRGQVLSLREMDYVTAARAIGATGNRVIWVHIFPAVVPFIVVAGTLTIAGAIITEASLSFLGLGVKFGTPTWGNMINAAQNLQVLQHQPWLWLPPGLAISTTVIAVNFVGDGLRDALDPRAVIQ